MLQSVFERSATDDSIFATTNRFEPHEDNFHAPRLPHDHPLPCRQGREGYNYLRFSVADQARSRDFYRAVLAREPSLDVPGMTEFTIGDATLGLMPSRGIKRLLGSAIEDPELAHTIPRCELYLVVDDPSRCAAAALAAGARLLSPLAARDWGHEVVYLADPDEHVIAFAKALS
jgi:catechol 2,3-dioxygenase-like lactoylglutathione lyase family enzyme